MDEVGEADAIPLVPRPVQMERFPGVLVLDEEATVRFRGVGDGARDAARRAVQPWLAWIRSATGYAWREAEPEGPASLVLGLSEDATPEGYRLLVAGDSIVVLGGDAAGLFYGLQTLRQLLPRALDRLPADAQDPSTVARGRASGRSSPGRGDQGTDEPVFVPRVRIEDRPRFVYRGMHLDVGRHLFPVWFIKRYIDLLSRYKMNTFHWHLTEDQGWRIEIDAYPRLTDIGAWRDETAVGKQFDPTGGDRSRFVGDGERYGGFYTKAEIRDVVAYAAERHVMVIPEIEMPGHSLAALAAYPELACTPGPFEVGKRWGVYHDIYCPTERTFAFLETVLGEVIELFPGPYIHIGGDEAPKTRWRDSPDAQAVMAREGLATEEELQGWFIRRIETFLSTHGRRLIGWDEILEGGLPPDATVMSWRGMEGGIAAARAGHDVVMTPTSHAYFDYYQSRARASEPLAIGGFTPLAKVYAFEPVPNTLTPTEASHVRGAQGNVWTEYMKTPEQVEYMVFPRLLAMAEVVWSPAAARDWRDFSARVAGQLARMDALGVRYRSP